jgi:hypothetical protein
MISIKRVLGYILCYALTLEIKKSLEACAYNDGHINTGVKSIPEMSHISNIPQTTLEAARTKSTTL